MKLSQLLLIFYARYRIIIGALLLTMLTTFALTLTQPKSYEATTTLVMNVKGTDPVTGLNMPTQPSYIATQIDIIQSKTVAMAVVEALGMHRSPAVVQQFNQTMGGRGEIRDWLSGILLKNLTVVPSRESNVITVGFRGSDPDFAAAVANAFASEYKKTAVQLRAQPMKDASAYFTAQMQALRDNVEQAQSRVSKFQQENGLVAVDNRLDVETSRLNDLSSQLVNVQGQLAEAQSRQRQTVQGDSAVSPDVLNNGLVQTLKSQLIAAEARLSEVSTKFGANNPAVQSARAEVDKLRSSLAAQMQLASRGVTSNATILQGREAEIRNALSAQRDKVLKLNRTRDELTVLTRDLDSSQRAYDALLNRFNQTSLEGQSNLTDVAVLSPAMVPVSPSSPRMSLNMALSLVLGLILGAGVAIVIEMLDRRVRSAADLETDDVVYLGAFSLGGANAPAAPKRLRAPWTRQLTAKA